MKEFYQMFKESVLLSYNLFREDGATAGLAQQPAPEGCMSLRWAVYDHNILLF